MEDSLIVSTVAVAISGIALGWNIVRDLVLRPRLIVKLEAKLRRDFTWSEGPSSANSFDLSGTITPLKCRTTIGKLTLDMPRLRETKELGFPFHHLVGKTIDSGEPCEIAWRCQSALGALNKCHDGADLVVMIYHAAAEKPCRKRIRLQIQDIK